MMAKAKKKPSARKRAQHQKQQGTEESPRRGLFGRSKKDTTRGKAHGAEAPQSVAGEGTVIQSTASKAGKALAWTAMVVVALLAVTGLALGARPAATPPPQTDGGAAPTTQQAGAYASQYVATWLRADEDSEEELAAYQAGSEVDLSLRGAAPTEFRDLSVASVEEQDSGIITVYISASLEVEEVIEDDEDADEDSEVRTVWEPMWYQVNVFPQGDDFSVLGYPAPVDAPESAEAPSLGYRDEAPEPLIETVEDFFPAYVTGEGDVGWMTHPDSDIESLTGHPYDYVEVTAVTLTGEVEEEVPEDGTTAQARVHVKIGQEDATRPATYAMTLETRGGRWEILSLDPEPELYVDNDGETASPDEEDGAAEDPEETEDTDTTGEPTTEQTDGTEEETDSED